MTEIKVKQKKGRAFHPKDYRYFINNQDEIMNNIIHKVCTDFEITKHELIGNTRRFGIVFPRQIVQYIARVVYKMSQQSIADATGLTNHSTIINSVESIENYLCTKNSMRDKIQYYISHFNKLKNECNQSR